MYIIDKNKDYYDHYSHIYGIDKRVVFDRRGSIKEDNGSLLHLSLWTAPRIHYLSDIKITDEFFLFLEVGYVQHIIKILNINIREYREGVSNKIDILNMEFSVINTYRNNMSMFGIPISISPINLPYNLDWSNYRKEGFSKRLYRIPEFYELQECLIPDKIIKNPILADTGITSLISGEEIWRELQNYISSLSNDKDCSIVMTDKEKAETHGFDNQSFRNPIK